MLIKIKKIFLLSNNTTKTLKQSRILGIKELRKLKFIPNSKLKLVDLWSCSLVDLKNLPSLFYRKKEKQKKLAAAEKYAKIMILR